MHAKAELAWSSGADFTPELCSAGVRIARLISHLLQNRRLDYFACHDTKTTQA